MSDMEQLVRQFGDAVRDHDERKAAELADLKASILVTGNDTSRKIFTQLAIIQKATKQINSAWAEIKIILDEDEQARKAIADEVEAMRPTPGMAQITHNQETGNGE